MYLATIMSANWNKFNPFMIHLPEMGSLFSHMFRTHCQKITQNRQVFKFLMLGVAEWIIHDCNLVISYLLLYSHSTRLLAATTLRNVLGTKNLAEILSERETISQVMQNALDEATDPWGVKVIKSNSWNFVLFWKKFVFGGFSDS